MRLILILDHRFIRDRDGSIFSRYRYDSRYFEDRYLQVFDSVKILVRVEDAIDAESGARIESERVSVKPLPMWSGPVDAARKLRKIRKAIESEIEHGDAVLLSVPGVAATSIGGPLRKSRRVYGVEVIGDPALSLSPGAYRHVLRIPIQWQQTRAMRQLVRDAAVASYVTREALQSKYPPGANSASFGISDVSLNSADFRSAPRVYDSPLIRPRLVFVGTLEKMYKAPDILLKATRICIDDGLDPTLTLVGGGRYIAELQQLASELGIANNVRFMGAVQGRERVREILSENDLFILPSRQEGLPRAMVEAMAQALPCIGTRVGGIPELLTDECLVPVDNIGALAQAISRFCQQPARLTHHSAENLRTACGFNDQVLDRERKHFYQSLKERTQLGMGAAARDPSNPVELAIGPAECAHRRQVRQSNMASFELNGFPVFGNRTSRRNIKTDRPYFWSASIAVSRIATLFGFRQGHL